MQMSKLDVLSRGCPVDTAPLSDRARMEPIADPPQPWRITSRFVQTLVHVVPHILVARDGVGTMTKMLCNSVNNVYCNGCATCVCIRAPLCHEPSVEGVWGLDVSHPGPDPLGDHRAFEIVLDSVGPGTTTQQTAPLGGPQLAHAAVGRPPMEQQAEH